MAKKVAPKWPLNFICDQNPVLNRIFLRARTTTSRFLRSLIPFNQWVFHCFCQHPASFKYINSTKYIGTTMIFYWNTRGCLACKQGVIDLLLLAVSNPNKFECATLDAWPPCLRFSNTVHNSSKLISSYKYKPSHSHACTEDGRPDYKSKFTDANK